MNSMRSLFPPPALALAFLALAFVRPAPAISAPVEIGPEADLCAEINSLPPGGELVLRPGDYAGPCAIRVGGLPGSPTVIRAKSLAQRPRIVYDGVTTNTLDVRADNVTIRGLALGPTQRNVDGIRIFARAGVTVEDCEFTGLGGIAVVANHTSNQGFVVRRNIIRDSGATAMYFGCHDGIACQALGLLIERNFIETVRAPDPEIGYGIQIKLNSTAVLRDNVVLDTKGPGIMVYGSLDLARVSVVEGNFVMGSLRSSGIVVGGGPVIVRNNVAVLNAAGGVGLEDYGRRHLLRGVVVAHNTLYRNELGGITVTRNGALNALLVNNAVQPRPGSPALPEPSPGLRGDGNVDCGVLNCFVDGEGRDFSPAPGGPLATTGAVRLGSWVPAMDFFGAPRAVPPSVGAVERLEGPIPLAPKP
jgi:hypothetical protein